MAVSRALRRLLRVLDLEEEFRRRELASAKAELAKLEIALQAAGQREKHGRRLVTSGAHREDSQNRLAGLVESRAGQRHGVVIERRIESSTRAVDELRAAFLEKRVERRQAETLVEEAEARDAIESGRRTQQSLDNWYLTRVPEEKSRK